jgi:hypothetical protein
LATIYRTGVDPLIVCYCDADYASDPNSHPPRRSTSGAVVLMAGGPIMWSSKTQPNRPSRPPVSPQWLAIHVAPCMF